MGQSGRPAEAERAAAPPSEKNQTWDADRSVGNPAMSEAVRTDTGRESPTRPLYPQLRPGPGLPREAVAEDQRARLLGAMVELVAERGYGAVTVRDLAHAAGVSKASFYAMFSGKEDCFLSTCEAVISRARQRVVDERSEAGVEASGRIRAGLVALTAWIVAEPKAARLILIEAPQVGTVVAERVDQEIGCFKVCLTKCLDPTPGGADPPPPLVRAIAAGIAHTARACLLHGREGAFAECVEPLVEWSVSFEGATSLGPLVRAEVPQRPSSGSLSGRDEGLDRATAERDGLLTAALSIAERKGFEALTPSRIRAAARVSRGSFRANFDDVTDCFLTALARRADPLLWAAELAYERGSGWASGVCLVMASVTDVLASDPPLARLGFVDLLDAGPTAFVWRQELIAALAERLCDAAPAELRPTRLAAEASVAACWALVDRKVRADEIHLLPHDAGTLALLAVAPALGPDRALAAIRSCGNVSLAQAGAASTYPGQAPGRTEPITGTGRTRTGAGASAVPPVG